MLTVERDNPSLKGVLPKDYAHPRLGKEHADSFHRDLHPDLKADYVLQPVRRGRDPQEHHRGRPGGLPPYKDIPGFYKSATLDDIRAHGHILTPGRYVGAAEVEDDGEPFGDKMVRLTADLREQQEQAAKLDKIIWANLEDIGYGG